MGEVRNDDLDSSAKPRPSGHLGEKLADVRNMLQEMAGRDEVNRCRRKGLERLRRVGDDVNVLVVDGINADRTGIPLSGSAPQLESQRAADVEVREQGVFVDQRHGHASNQFTGSGVVDGRADAFVTASSSASPSRIIERCLKRVPKLLIVYMRRMAMPPVIRA